MLFKYNYTSSQPILGLYEIDVSQQIIAQHYAILKGESLRKGILKEKYMLFYCIVDSFRVAQFDRNEWHDQTDIPNEMALKFKHRKIADYLRPTFQTKHSFSYAFHKGK